MSRVIVGVDPHKRSVTIEAVDERARVLATGRFGTDTSGYRLMLRYVRAQWSHRRWAIEGANGAGRPLAIYPYWHRAQWAMDRPSATEKSYLQGWRKSQGMGAA